MISNYTPKLVKVIREKISKEQLMKEILSGIIVGVVALPLSIALAIASGVKPEQGLFTAIIAGFLISLLGGSRVQIGGPTGAFVIIIYNIVQKHGYNGLAVAGIIAGILLVIFGFLKLGNVIKFIPYPVTIGFTSGIALLIFTSQISDFMGFKIKDLPADFAEKVLVLVKNIPNLNFSAFLIGFSTILLSLSWSRYFKKIPGYLIAIIVTTLAVKFLDLPVETIGSRFGEVPNMLPSPSLPEINLQIVKELFLPAVSIALLAGIESLLSAVVADGMTGTRHNSNMELVAQGIANIFSPIFGGIPATGALARTAVNIRNGGRTPIAGMVHAVTLLVIMLFLGQLASLIPLATLAGILIIVSYNMSEVEHFWGMRKAPKSDILILLLTFILTVFADLTIAIQFGVILSALLFMKRMADVSVQRQILRQNFDEDEEFIASRITKKDVPSQVEMFEINGPFFFGAASVFKEELSHLKPRPLVLILRMRHVPAIDATGIAALEWIRHKSAGEHTQVILSGLQEQPAKALEGTDFLKKLGKEHIFGNINEAIKWSQNYVSKII